MMGDIGCVCNTSSPTQQTISAFYVILSDNASTGCIAEI
jgi:hypothetical protein